MSKKYLLLLWIALCLFASAQQKIIKKCTRCNFVEKRQQAKFCIHCGQKLTEVAAEAVLVCPKCNKPVDEGGRFCAFCGERGKIVYRPIAHKKYGFPEEYRPATEPLKPKKPLRPSKRKSSNKIGINKFLYPDAVALEKHQIREGLPHTSRKRTIVRTLFISEASPEQIEIFYRRLYPDLPLLRVTMYEIFSILKMKARQRGRRIEIAYYSFSNVKSDAIWENRRRQIENRLSREMAPFQSIDREIAALEKLITDGKVARSQVQERLYDLAQRRNIIANSPTYWDITALHKVVTLRKNILLITHLVRKK